MALFGKGSAQTNCDYDALLEIDTIVRTQTRQR